MLWLCINTSYDKVSWHWCYGCVWTAVMTRFLSTAVVVVYEHQLRQDFWALLLWLWINTRYDRLLDTAVVLCMNSSYDKVSWHWWCWCGCVWTLDMTRFLGTAVVVVYEHQLRQGSWALLLWLCMNSSYDKVPGHCCCGCVWTPVMTRFLGTAAVVVNKH